jgi:hypothetical protein
MEYVRNKLVYERRLPYRWGRLQESTRPDARTFQSQGIVLLLTNVPYAERLYYTPGLNFTKYYNERAAGRWFDRFVTGVDRHFIEQKFAERVKSLLNRY